MKKTFLPTHFFCFLFSALFLYGISGCSGSGSGDESSGLDTGLDNGVGDDTGPGVGVPEAYHYVRADAAGNNDGSDWENAWTELPVLLERQHAYYIADGTYPVYQFDDAEDGDRTIFIIKATESDHGTDSGWNASYGDSQAIFSAHGGDGCAVTISSSYWSINGQTGLGGRDYGFKFTADEDVDYVVCVEDPSWSNTVFHDIRLSYFEIQHRGTDIMYQGDVKSGRGFYVHSQAAMQDSSLSHCYIHDTPGISIYYSGATQNNLIEYCIVARNHSDAAWHGEGIQSGSEADNNIVRFSIWEDIEGTAVIVGKNGWQVYGNLFYYTTDYPHAGQSGSGVGMGIFTGLSNNKVYNNTVYGLTGTNAAFSLANDDTGNEIYNNMWVNSARLRFTGEHTSMDANYIFNCMDVGFMDSIVDDHFQTGT